MHSGISRDSQERRTLDLQHINHSLEIFFLFYFPFQYHNALLETPIVYSQ